MLGPQLIALMTTSLFDLTLAAEKCDKTNANKLEFNSYAPQGIQKEEGGMGIYEKRLLLAQDLRTIWTLNEELEVP